MNRLFYITTSIPYVNARPHLGFALEAVIADSIARYHRLRGRRVRFQSGTDDNSLSNVAAAREQGITTRELVDRNAVAFHDLAGALDLSYDAFVRTSNSRCHADGVSKLWRACLAAGDFYKRDYRGLYCVGCEDFYSEGELVSGRCPAHSRALEVVEEENYFFRLSRYETEIRTLIEEGRLDIKPVARLREVKAFLDRGLRDISVSRAGERAGGWGIPVPDDPAQVIYVWFDALANYVNGPGYSSRGSEFADWWSAAERVHVIGKDIIRQHAVLWPAILASAGLDSPNLILVHGFLSVDGRKLSKSLGTGIDPFEAIDRLGADALRYYLLAKVSPFEDTDFTWKSFEAAYSSELADQLGNLVSRTVKLIETRCGGIVPNPGLAAGPGAGIASLAESLDGAVADALADFNPKQALNHIWNVVRDLNRYIVREEPWNAGEPQLSQTLYTCAEGIRLVGLHLRPFLPSAAKRILGRIGGDASDISAGPHRWGGLHPGSAVRPGGPLFPKAVRAGST